MKILHVSDRLSNRGGADWHMLSVIGAQLERGHDVHLAVEAIDETVEPPCEVHGLEALPDSDITHIHNVMDPAQLTALRARGPVLMTVQDHRTFCPGRGKLTLEGTVCAVEMGAETCAACFEDADYFRRILERTSARLAAIRDLPLVVLSEYMRRELSAVGARRVSVIPPFVHGLNPEAKADGPPCVLFAGRVVRAKGVHDAVEVHRRSGVDLPLVIAGTGSERDSVGAIGWQSRDQLSRLYRRAEVLIMPSRWQEPFGIVGLEALWMGTPVAAWDSGGVTEWFPDATPWGDLDALAALTRRQIGTTGHVPRGFERNALMGQLDSLYKEVVRVVQ